MLKSLPNCIMVFKKWFAAACICLALVSSAEATPAAAIILSDQIVGTTSDSFFVIRTTTLRPPSYYEYTKRMELVEISNVSGQIEQSCVVRETAYEFDHEAALETWRQAELAPAGCQVFKILSERGANYIEPEITGPDIHEFRLSAEGISARETDQSDSSPWRLLLTLDELRARALKITTISASTLPWPTGGEAGESDAVSILGGDEWSEPLVQICELRSAPVRSLRLEWYFLKIVCWSGDDDMDGANFYVPISALALKTESQNGNEAE